MWVIQSRKMRWAEYGQCTGEKKNTYRGLVVKSEGTRPLGKPKHRWDDDIKMDLKERAWPGLMWLRIRACGELL
jgi:hypothetical protein